MCACPGMDSQVDVAIHTLVQTAPPALYYHLKVAEQLIWDPWGQSSEAQFAMLLMVRTLPPAVCLAGYPLCNMVQMCTDRELHHIASSKLTCRCCT